VSGEKRNANKAVGGSVQEQPSRTLCTMPAPTAAAPRKHAGIADTTKVCGTALCHRIFLGAIGDRRARMRPLRGSPSSSASSCALLQHDLARTVFVDQSRGITESDRWPGRRSVTLCIQILLAKAAPSRVRG
jgi:hypothetical protein